MFHYLKKSIFCLIIFVMPCMNLASKAMDENQNQSQKVITIRKGIPDHRIKTVYQTPCHNLVAQTQRMREDYERELREQEYQNSFSNGFFNGQEESSSDDGNQ